MRVHKQSSSAWIFLLTLLTCVFVTSHVPYSQASSTPNLYLDPPVVIVDLGKSFSINATIANVADLGGWELKLYYRNNILAIITATEGPFLKQGGSTAFFTVELNNNYNTTHGRIWLTCVLLGSVPGVNGNGTLTTINFQAVGGGNTTLHLTDTVLGDSQANPITHTTNDGNIQVIGISDIAITNVTPSKTIVGQGYTMKINVTVENQGDTTETFNVTAYANTTFIQTKTNTLPSGNSTTITLTWDTTSVAKGNYTITAYAEPVLGETDTLDNTFIDGTVYVGIVGDVNADDKVDMKDIGLCCLAYGSHPGDPRWNPNADINDDGKVDMKDIGIACMHYGETDP